MKRLIYALTSDPSADVLELEPCPLSAVTDAMWAQLAAQMACESTNMPCSGAILAHRAKEGYAAAAIWQGQVASYSSLIPVACGACPSGVPHTWASIAAAAGLNTADMPSLDVYQFASGWTNAAWRRKRINMSLRKLLLAEVMGERSLGLGGMAGLAQPLLAQLGWQILGWSATPFVSSLIGMPSAEFEECAEVGWRPPAGMERYEGPPIEMSDRTHPWSRFCYFWVSNPALARELDGKLAAACRGNLGRWRRAILNVASQPGALTRLAWLP